MPQIMLLVLILCPVAAAPPQCSLWSVHGTCAAFYAGWASMPRQGSPYPLTLPEVIMGIVSVGFGGSISGAETVVVTGMVMEYDHRG